MTKVDLIAKIARVLSDNNVRKKVHIDKRILKFTDITYKSEEVTGQISVKSKDKEVKYTIEDVSNILEATLACINDVLAHGDQVTIKGLGTFSVQYHKERTIRNPITGEMMEIPGRYVPKFLAGQMLRHSAKLYELSLENNPQGFVMPDPVYDQFEMPDEIEEELDGSED